MTAAVERARTVIVGGGASGLLAAARLGRGTLLLDGNPKPGKKLSATGNGRCNLTNLRITPDRYHGDVSAAASLLAALSADRVLEEFECLGLLTRADPEGRCYPQSLQAASVLQALWTACEEAGVETRWDFPVTEVRREEAGFRLRAADGREIQADRLVLAAGGRASPKHGGGRGYDLARSLGHTVTPLTPSLTPLKTDAKRVRPLKGQRCRARVTLLNQGRALAAESGEVIFGEDRLSGICVFDLSARLRENGYVPGAPGWSLSLDLLEDRDPAALSTYLRTLRGRWPDCPAGDLLAGAVNLRVGRELVKALGIPRDKTFRNLTDRELDRAAHTLKAWEFPLLGTGDWDSAQITAGGVPLAEVDLSAMASRKCPGLYLLGEMLDLDGDCGGFNLHWAWATALRLKIGEDRLGR